VAFEYHWWGLEDTDFKGDVVGEIVTRFSLEEHSFKDWQDFEQKMPHMAYAWTAATRFRTLEWLFVDLRVVPQMLGVVDLPVKSEVGDINRYEWLKSASDLALYRFSSIRDATLHFVNDLLELGIKDLDLKFKNLKSAIEKTHPNLVTLLREIGECGRSVRNDRNVRAHEGEVFLTEDDELFKFTAFAEAHGLKSLDGNTQADAVYREACERLYARVVSETDALMTKVSELTDSLLPDFKSRYFAKKQLTP
jgi:hypothetical protein